MNSRATRQFWKLYDALPLEIRQRARRAYELWLNDPRHPSIQFKKVDDQELIYSARVTDDYRVLGVLEDDTVTWFWIGKHEEYERMLK
ncbi:MAG: hypothetical protein H6658_18820 [Ardenticatenaceae bacterium]|nr:hypothetical protein [Ardenticatenaceae bacterium]